MRLDGDESLIHRWRSDQRDTVISRSNDQGLIEYVDFCASELSKFLGAVKANLAKGQWEISSKQGSGILTETSVNSLVILFRKVIFRDGLHDFQHYLVKLEKIGGFDFSPYRSSQYNRAAEDLLAKVYGK